MADRSSPESPQTPAPDPGSIVQKLRVPRTSPIAETSLFIAAVLASDVIWGAGDRFIHLDPHPFWVIVLFMAVQYGTTEALLATGACTIALLAGNMPTQAFGQSIHDYALQILLTPPLWMVA